MLKVYLEDCYANIVLIIGGWSPAELILSAKFYSLSKTKKAMETFSGKNVSNRYLCSMNELQEKWLQEVEALFLRYGIKSITMDDVARELGISKKTLYQFVDNKDDLVQRVISRYIELEKNLCSSLFTEASNALEEIRMVIASNTSLVSQMRTNIVFDLQRYHRDAWNLLLNYQNNFLYQVVHKNLMRGIQEGLYRSSFNVDIMTRLHVGSAFQLFDEQVFPSATYSRAEVFREFMESYIYGVVSEEGRRLFEEMVANNR